MRKEDSGRRFSRELKLAAVQRMAMGANVSKLSRSSASRARVSFEWQKQFRLGGASALRGAGRPRRAEAVQLQAKDPAVPALSDTSDELSKGIGSHRRSGTIGWTEDVDLDFFSASLAASWGRTPAERRDNYLGRGEVSGT
jgi:transposase-like protein